MNKKYAGDSLLYRNSLWSIAYHSRMSAPLSDGQLYELAVKADARNRTLGLSGVLLVRNDHFFQILEGHEGFVTDLYQSIEADPRHTTVTRVFNGPIVQPAFSGWNMRLITPEDISSEERGVVDRAMDWVERQGSAGPNTLGLAALEACSHALARGVHRTQIGRSPPEIRCARCS